FALIPRAEEAAPVPQAERTRGERGRRGDRVLRALAGFLNAAHQVFGVAAVGAGHGVGPVDDLQARSSQGAPDSGHRDRDRLLHRPKAPVVVVADALVFRTVIEVIAEDEPALRIEPGAALRHQAQRLVGREDAVLDLIATGEDGGPDALGAVGVHERPQAESPRLAARRLELRVAHGPGAAFPDAL